MITGETRVAAIIGDPVRHSLSPALYNAAFDATGLDWVFVAFEVAAGGGAAAVRAMRALGLEGLSVTMPHKADVVEACDALSVDAGVLQSVNHVRVVDGATFGDSTDGPGFVRALTEKGVGLDGRRMLLLGAGGAARAVAVAAKRAGAAVTCAARRVEAAEAVALLCGGEAADLDAAGDLAEGADLIVNATPLGMADSGTDAARPPLPAAVLQPRHVVVDLVYHPLDTPLLRAALAAGATPVDGLGMLLHQAAIQFEAWTAQPAPIDAMRAAARSELASRP